MYQWQKTYPSWISFLSILLLILLWQIVCLCGVVSPLFLPSPLQILMALWSMILDGEIARSLAASLYRIILGFLFGSLLGLVVGLLTGTSALNDRIGTPLVNIFYPIPKIA